MHEHTSAYTSLANRPPRLLDQVREAVRGGRNNRRALRRMISHSAFVQHPKINGVRVIDFLPLVRASKVGGVPGRQKSTTQTPLI